MKPTRKTVAIFVLSIGMAACTPTSKFPTVDAELAKAEAYKQQMAALKIKLKQENRLANIAHPILTSNVELCGKRIAHRVGSTFMTLDSIEKDWREVYSDHLGLTDSITAISVAAGSPAASAGLMTGDVIIGLNEKTYGSGKRQLKRFSKHITKLNRASGDELTLRIQRNSKPHVLTLEPAPICDHGVIMTNTNDVNAWADGNNIYISSGMLRFAEDDTEIAVVVGHELAHNTRNHMRAKATNRVFGALLGAVVSAASGVNVTDLGAQAGQQAFSQDFESEADYVGIYHAARAGFDIEHAAAFWRKMSEIHPGSIHLAGSTHPSTAKRFLAVENAVEEINTKRAENIALIPEEAKSTK